MFVYMFLSRYISHWYGVFFLCWLAMYMTNFQKQTLLYLNPLYMAYALCFGFIFLELYHIFVLQSDLELSLLVFKTVNHVLPLLLLVSIGFNSHKNALRNILWVTITYLLYMLYTEQNIYEIYFTEKYPRGWKQVRKLCTQTNSPVCNFLDMIL